MLNNVTIMGRLCADPELKRTQSDIPVTSFRIAVERNYSNQDGKRETDFFDVTAWRGTAEIICEYFCKGRMIAINGRLETQHWKDRDGNNRVSVGIVADSIYFADSKRAEEDEDDGRGRKSNRKPAAKGRKSSRPVRDEEYEDEYEDGEDFEEEDSFDEDGYEEPPRRGNSNGRKAGSRKATGSRRAA